MDTATLASSSQIGASEVILRIREGLTFRRVDYSSPQFKLICALRSTVMGSSAAVPDSMDQYSEHYAAFRKTALVAALRVTRASAGALDCEEYYPQPLIAACRHQVCSASRFVAMQDTYLEALNLSRSLIEAAWQDQLRRGTRLDIVNVHRRGLSYYGRLGYHLVKDSFFFHPVWGTPSYVMVFAAHSALDSPLSHLFAGLDDGFDLRLLNERVSFASWRLERSRSDFETAGMEFDA